MAMVDVDLQSYGLFDPHIQQCPWPYYAKMRTDAPVFAVPGTDYFLVTRYDLVADISKSYEDWSNQFGNASLPVDKELGARLKALREEMGGWVAVPTLLTADPPAQTRFRKVIAKAFHPNAINRFEPAVREITSRLIDSWIETGQIEFVSQFGVPLPVEVIARVLNVPDDRLADFKRWSDDSIAGIGSVLTNDQRVAAERGVLELQRYFANELEKRSAHPQDDLLTHLQDAQFEEHEGADARPLTMGEKLSILQQLLVAGNETTTKMLTEMVRLLAENPKEWERLRADQTHARSVVEETLRLSTPTQGMWRIATRDAIVEGVHIPKGARLVIMYSAANRDPEIFDDPESFCPERSGLGNHLAFGKGVHYCIGAPLSRLEGRVAAEELSRRLVTLSMPDSNRFEYHPSFMLRGLKRLDLQFSAA